ncbi:MAG: (2Fe-2S) ferredoxin domain-containing protein [Campylobacterota bacterium]|nr:(2Fe-2S) ferredoxin domain-containing protein [Campylobacterota bacterium]
MEKISTMGSKINIMGSEVVEGFECKPKVLDMNKPMMHYKNIINVCVDKRCSENGSSKAGDDLRELIKECDLVSGENRIKVTRTFCQGACRHGQVANIFSNTQKNGLEKHNNIWLRKTHEYDKQKWTQLLYAIRDAQDLDRFEQIKMKVF